tara:strand:- start:210 stop:410 length:201 start_codon:yes stop_codon:yes gene_type:complete
MCVFFLFEYIVYKINDKCKFVEINKNILGKKEDVYENPYIPRYDDFIFNIIGVVLYYITKNVFIVV